MVFQSNHDSIAVKMEQTENTESVPFEGSSFVDMSFIEQGSNGKDLAACGECIDRATEVRELQTNLDALSRKLELQERLTDYWRQIALKHEPEHDNPEWALEPKENMTAEPLDVPSKSPPKVFKRKCPQFYIVLFHLQLHQSLTFNHCSILKRINVARAMNASRNRNY